MKNHKKQNKTQTIKFKTIIFSITIIILFILVSPAYASPITESKLTQLTNQERLSRGLNNLDSNPLLYFAAHQKAQDMIEKDYFEHYTPYGKSPWDFIHNSGYEYIMAGENLAMDFKTSEGIQSAWMASPSHRDNILRPEYEDIAIATAKGDFNGHQTTVVVQMFGKQDNNILSDINNWVVKIRDFILGF